MNLFELAAVLLLDHSDYDKGLNDALDKANSFGSSLKSGLVATAKAGAAAIGAASTAVAAFSKQALDSYGNYEQLAGGIETLFGTGGLSLEEYAKAEGKTVDEVESKYRELEKSQADAMANAAAAYTTAGLSANDYMETITGFAASLKQSLGEENIGDLASYANQAIVDMSDNANKMGTSMDSIIYTYQGFAKQNYVMLDNLKLGYGGTKTEMERLLADAEKLMGLEVGSLDISNFSDIIVAIHAVQEELGIAGTTAKEASSTIQGSLASMKSAWENLISGIANENADLPGLMTQVIDSAVTVGENIVPRIKQILEGIGTAIEQLSPILSERVMPMISDMLPDIVAQGVSLITNLVDAIVNNLEPLANAAIEIGMTLIKGIGDILPKLVTAGLQIITTLANGIADNIEAIIGTIADIGQKIAETFTNPETQKNLLDAGINLINSFVDGITANIDSLTQAAVDIVMELINGIGEILPKLVTAGLQIITALANGIGDNIGTIIGTIVDVGLQIIETLTNPETMKNLLDAGLKIIKGLINGLLDAIPKIIDALPQIIQNIIDFLMEAIPMLIDTGLELFTALVGALPDIITKITNVLPQIITSIVIALMELMPEIMEAGITLISALVDNLPAIISAIALAVPRIITGLVETFSKEENLNKMIEAGKKLFKTMIENTGKLIEIVVTVVPEIIKGLIDAFKNDDSTKKMVEAGKNIVQGLWDGILKMKDWIQEKVSGFFGGIVDNVKETLGIHSPSKVFAEIGKFSALGVGEGFDSEFESVKRDIDKQLDFTATANVQASGNTVSYSGYTATNQGGFAPGIDVRQPLVVVLQLPSGVEVGRQYIEDINLAKRVDGLAY